MSLNFEIVAFSTAKGLTMVTLSDILYCRSNGNYAAICLINQTSLFISKTLKDLESFLPQHWFVRIHHQTLVNKMHIRQYNKSEGTVLLTDGTVLAIAVRKRSILTRYFKVL
ncbi:MAG: LytR/AlgR family response regulator transcription factor [Saprospiraceae bacterium]